MYYYSTRRRMRHRMMWIAEIKNRIRIAVAFMADCGDDLLAGLGMTFMVFFLFPIIIRIGGFLK